MKIAIIFLALLACSYSRVLHIGIDGLLQKCLSKAKHTVFDYMQANGSYTYSARTSIETFSGPGWSNILCGMDTEMTGITTNLWRAPWLFKASNPVTSSTGNEVMPCLWNTIKKQKPEFKVGAAYDWDWFLNLSNTSIPGTLEYDFFCNGVTVDMYYACEKLHTQKVIDSFDKGFDYFFLYLGQVDEEGHETTFCGDQYVKRITIVMDLIENLMYELKQRGMLDDTHIVINSDHGATYGSTHHGDQTDENLLVPWMIAGPGIKKNYHIEGNVKNLDVTATICKILGVTPDSNWKSRSVDEIFEKKQNLK